MTTEEISDVAEVAMLRQQLATEQAMRVGVEEEFASVNTTILLLHETMPVMLVYIDQYCEIKYFNNAFRDGLGRKASQIENTQLHDVLGETVYDVLKIDLANALGGKAVHRVCENETAFGRQSRLLMQYLPKLDSADIVVGVFLFATDISHSDDFTQAAEVVAPAPVVLRVSEEPAIAPVVMAAPVMPAAIVTPKLAAAVPAAEVAPVVAIADTLVEKTDAAEPDPFDDFFDQNESTAAAPTAEQTFAPSPVAAPIKAVVVAAAVAAPPPPVVTAPVKTVVVESRPNNDTITAPVTAPIKAAVLTPPAPPPAPPVAPPAAATTVKPAMPEKAIARPAATAPAKAEPPPVEEELNAETDEDAILLRNAIEQNEFCLYFQKIESLTDKDNAPPFREILLRLDLEEANMIPPGSFMPVAEKYGMLPDLDRWVVRNLLKWMRLQDDPLQTMYSVNISSPTLSDIRFPVFVLNGISKLRVPGAQLCFEIEERDILSHPIEAIKFIRQIQKAGCLFALCSFSGGRESLEFLRQVQVNFLKIDGELILNMMRSADDLARVNSIQRLALALKVRTVAEYVEDNKTLEKLRSIGVHYAQGFGISRPQKLEQVSTARKQK